MADSLSPARHSVPGVTSTALAGVMERPWAGFWLLAVVHATIWTLLPYAFYQNLPLDLIEALTYGQEWQLGYDKLPPMPWWFVELAYRTFGSDFALYCLGQISVLAAFAAVWALMLRIANPAAALAAVLIIDGLHYFNYTAPKFNHDVIQLPFWALAGLALHGALRTGRPTHWMTLGLSIGLAFWAKYFVVILGLPFALFMLIDRRARRLLTTPGPYVAVAIALVVVAPHLAWLADNHFPPLDYLRVRAQSLNTLSDRLGGPALFAVGQLFWLLPVFAIALPLLRRPREADATTADDYDRRIFAVLAFGPAATVIAMSALSGRGLVSMWGYPPWLFLGPGLVVKIGAWIDGTCLTRVVGVWAAVTAVYAPGLHRRLCRAAVLRPSLSRRFVSRRPRGRRNHHALPRRRPGHAARLCDRQHVARRQYRPLRARAPAHPHRRQSAPGAVDRPCRPRSAWRRRGVDRRQPQRDSSDLCGSRRQCRRANPDRPADAPRQPPDFGRLGDPAAGAMSGRAIAPPR